MKKIKALKSFSGAVTLGKGQVKHVPDDIANDVIKAGLAESADGDKKKDKPKKGGKKNDTESGDGK